jgi:hypothetical protein
MRIALSLALRDAAFIAVFKNRISRFARNREEEQAARRLACIIPFSKVAASFLETAPQF